MWFCPQLHQNQKMHIAKFRHLRKTILESTRLTGSLLLCDHACLNPSRNAESHDSGAARALTTLPFSFPEVETAGSMGCCPSQAGAGSSAEELVDFDRGWVEAQACRVKNPLVTENCRGTGGKEPTIVVIGATGAGKSSFLNLMCGGGPNDQIFYTAPSSESVTKAIRLERHLVAGGQIRSCENFITVIDGPGLDDDKGEFVMVRPVVVPGIRCLTQPCVHSSDAEPRAMET